MKVSNTGLKMIESFEGCRLTAYKCLPSEKYYTIGFGHYGADVKKGQTITKVEAEKLFRKDLERFEKSVNKYASQYNFNQNQFDALVSFAYNCGTGALDELLDYGHRLKSTIVNELKTYVYSGGVIISGLVRRRKAEANLFNKSTKKKPTNYDVAFDVMSGKYGNGDTRKKKIEALGYNYEKVQECVNYICCARDVLRGLYGNGETRKKRLEALGYNYTKVQNLINSGVVK